MRSSQQERSPEATGDEHASSGSSDGPPHEHLRERVRTDARRGGAVLRYHTWPTVQRQTLSDHQWNVVRLLVTIWPEAPKEAILNAQFHDIGELVTGDPPYPVKARNPVLKAEVDRLEGDGRAAMGVGVHMNCSTGWRQRIKLCDVLEMWEFCLDEVALGNSFCRALVRDMAELRIGLALEFGLAEEEIARIRRYETERMNRQP